MRLRHCLLTFDTGEAVLRPVTVAEHRRRDGTTSAVTGSFNYEATVRLTPARRRALRAMLRPKRAVRP